jgi:cell division protein FtsI (penicillin-binding protein 3)
VTRGANNRKKRTAALQRRRLVLLLCLGVLGYFLLISRAVQLQAIDAEWLSARARNQHQGTLHLGPLRGEIEDRHGTLLAASADSESVAASPKLIVDKQRAGRELAAALGIPQAELRKRLHSTRSFVWVKRWITPDQADRVRRLNLEGIRLHPERKRFYPSRGLAAAYVGFAGRDGEGLSGLELAFNSALRGASASMPFQRDAHGQRLIHWRGNSRARSGARATVSLDAGLQYFAESALERAIADTGARHAMLIALAPHTGDVLALAEWPTFNPNRFWLEDPQAFRARAFVDPFEPGSTLKPFVVGLALEAGVVKPSDRFDCENGRWRVLDRWIRDFKPHGILSVRDILQLSSNIGTAKVAERLGSARLTEGLQEIGFGQRTGSGFPGEATGVVRTLSEAQAVERANLAFGQGITVTALQLATAGAMLANGGHRVQPRLVLRLEGPDGALSWPKGIGERVLSQRTTGTVMEMMRAAVQSGTGQKAALPHHSVAGKTGTSQKVINGTYSNQHFVASFLGIVPSRKPRLVVVIVIDDPQGAYTGGLVAAPLFQEFGSFAVEQLGLPAEDSV